MFAEALALQSKLTKSFSHHAFRGEGDVFLRKMFKFTHAHRSFNITPENSEGPVPMREGDAFGGIQSTLITVSAHQD
jgi:hypothetical protein